MTPRGNHPGNPPDHDSEWHERLQDWLDGDLEGEERAALERHLAGCAHCQETLERLQDLDRELQSALPKPSLDQTFDARLFARIDEIEDQRSAARARAQAEAESELAVLAGQWRRTLQAIVPSIVAAAAVVIGLATSIADMVGMTNVQWLQALSARSEHAVGTDIASFLPLLALAGCAAAASYVVARWLSPIAES